MAEEAVKVAVRVRPFNQREKGRSAKLVIGMEGQSTLIEDPDNIEPAKTFTFDHSYWSHDGFKELPNGYLEPDSSSSKYASQQKVFEDLGRGVLENAFQGFNCSLFAYGQTGSGKSYSMIGYGVNKGIVPVTCEELFKRIEKSKDKSEVTFSMLEIYNEQVNDLLSKDVHRGGLQVRQHPSQGYFYAQDLKRVPVGSYVEIERRIEEGTANRTVASTNMNATSSRAHTIVTITFDQIFNSSAGETKKSSVINLVDLAGSERADSTGATGDRLKEGANINKSLSVLGNVISALADQSTGKKKVIIPYRDSVLTKLLQNALGGNSKTVMIAALSPADINYSETLSTLRYADRAKRIKTKAIVNENPVDKLIRELKEENERLKGLMDSKNLNLDKTAMASLSKEEIEAMKKQMYEELKAQMQMNQKLLQETNTSFKERLQMAQKETDLDAQETAKKEERKVKVPYLTNLNEDSLLSYVICHFIDQEKIKVGRTNDCQIQISGLGILSDHAYLICHKGKVSLQPGQKGAKIKVNGQNVEDSQVLEHNDRILFGSSNLFVFVNPSKQSPKEKKITWELAQNEIAEAKGFSLKNTSLTKEQQLIQEEIIELLPAVTEVNAISDELNKHRQFEVILVPSIAFEDYNPHKSSNSNQRIMIRMTNLKNLNEWLWDKGKFMNRKYMMQDLYQKFLDGEEYILRLKKDQDPFWEPPEDLFIGLSNFFLQSLCYCMDFEDKAYISDYKGQEIGTMKVHVAPCAPDGKPLGEKAYIDDSNKLIAKPFNFSVVISSCEIANRENVVGFKMKFKVFGVNNYIETPLVKNAHEMKFNFNQIISYKSITQEHLNFFEHGCITFLVYAEQKELNTVKHVAGLSTRELKILRENEKNESNVKSELKLKASSDIDPTQIKLELSLLQRKFEILEERELQIQRLCNGYAKNNRMSKDLQQFIAELNKILAAKGKANN